MDGDSISNYVDAASLFEEPSARLLEGMLPLLCWKGDVHEKAPVSYR